MEFCVSYETSPENRCQEITKADSVFCEKHSKMFVSLYLAYKKKEIKPIKNIKEASILSLLKQISKYQKAIDLRIQFRERAVSYDSRDHGHLLRLEVLQQEIEKIISELEIRFSDEAPLRLPPGTTGTTPEVPTHTSTEKEAFIATVKTYQKSKKKDLGWLSKVNKYIKTIEEEQEKIFKESLEVWEEVYSILGVEGKFTEERIHAGFLLLMIFSSCIKYLIPVYHVTLKEVKQAFRFNKVWSFDEMLPFDSCELQQIIESLRLFDRMIDDFLETQSCFIISTSNFQTVDRMVWYVGKNFSLSIKAVSQGFQFIITSLGPNLPKEVNSKDLTKLMDEEFPLGPPSCSGGPKDKKYNELQAKLTTHLMEDFKKRIQIAKKLPLKKEEYLDKLVKEYSKIFEKYPYFPENSTTDKNTGLRYYYSTSKPGRKRT